MSGCPSSLPASLPAAPALVLSGASAFARTGDMLLGLGARGLIVRGKQSYARVQVLLEESLRLADLTFEDAWYGEDCCESELERLVEQAQSGQAQWILGVGGGKALDLAKLVAQRANLPVVTAPTSPATWAAWTSTANIHDPKGLWLRELPLARSPYATVLDEDVLARAPLRHLAAGMAAALALSHQKGGADAPTCQLASSMSERIHATGGAAYAQASAGERARELHEMVLATIQLAGMIAEHARATPNLSTRIANALTSFPQAAKALHGERVAFGLLVQTLLQGTETEAKTLIDFLGACELPLTFAQLGLDSSALEALLAAILLADASASALPGPSPQALENALQRADALGQAYLDTQNRR